MQFSPFCGVNEWDNFTDYLRDRTKPKSFKVQPKMLPDVNKLILYILELSKLIDFFRPFPTQTTLT